MFLQDKDIYEILLMEETIRQLLMQGSDASTIKKAASSHGMESLRFDGARKIFKGQTSVAEVLRVTQEDILFDE